jgi:hypothetical protein
MNDRIIPLSFEEYNRITKAEEKREESAKAYREELIQFAESIDQLRIKANSIPALAPQVGTYGKLSSALIKVLEELLSLHEADRAYNAIIDGSSVRDAIAMVESNVYGIEN